MPLYFYPFPISAFPGTDTVELFLNAPCRALARWTARHLLHFTSPLATEFTSSGDMLYDYLRLLDVMLIAAIGTIVWSLLDRRKTHYRMHYAWLRVYARYALGSSILPYGTAKWLPIQFPRPLPEVLLQTFGESSPMRLLWTFMGYSRGYTIFVGTMEIVGPLLLFFRRTTTLGALITGAVMLNVVMLNLTYDVPVKLYSSHLLAVSVFLAAADLKRLANVFLFNRACDSANIAFPVPLSLRWTRAKAVAKGLCIGGLLVALFVDDLGRVPERNGVPISGLYGIYEVTDFVRNGTTVPPLLTEPTRWRWITVRKGKWTVRAVDDSVQRFQTENARDHALTLFKSEEPIIKYEVSYSESNDQQYVFRTTLNGETIVAAARKIDETKFPLLSRGFHWRNETPFNN